MLSSALLILLVLLVCSYIYSNLSNRLAPGVIPLSEYNLNIRSKAKYWELLQVISFPLVFIYNQVVMIAWIIKEIFRFIQIIIKWIYTNLIVNGLWLLFKLFFFYFISWPWKILRLAFEQIKPSWNRAFYKIGVIGLFFTFILAFTGRFLVEQFEFSQVVEYVFAFFSIIPIVWALSKISARCHRGSEVEKESSFTTSLYAIYLAVSAGFLICIQALLFYVSSLTSVGPLLSSLFTSGSIFLSFVLIFNCVALLFLLSVFPNHLLNESRNKKDVFKSFFKHLFHKWPQYIVAAVAIIIPAGLLSLIPILLFSGSVFLTENILHKVFERRVNDLEMKIVETNPKGSIHDWIDPDKTAEAFLFQILEQYKINKGYEIEKENLKLNANFLNRELSKFSFIAGAAPVIGVAFEAVGYHKLQSKVNPIQGAFSVSDAENYQNSLALEKESIMNDISKISSNQKNELKRGEENKLALETKLNNVCVKIISYISEPPRINQPIVFSDTKVQDQCEDERVRLRGLIEQQEIINAKFEEKISRLIKLRTAVEETHSKFIEESDARNSIFKLAYLFLGIGISFFLAICFGFVLPIFGRLNYEIYFDQKNDEQWYISQCFSDANKSNRNQPLLGLLLTIIIIGLLFLKAAAFSNEMGFLSKDMFSSIISSEERVRNNNKINESLDQEYINERQESMFSEGSSVEESHNLEIDTINELLGTTETYYIAPSTEKLLNSDFTEPKGNTDLNLYYVLVEKFTTENEAFQSNLNYKQQGIFLQVIAPGTFLGQYDNYYLLCAASAVSSDEARRVKNQLDGKGISSTIQNY